jgi:hypothetical protein
MRVGAVLLGIAVAVGSAAIAPGKTWVRSASAADCDATELVYALAGSLRITDTPFGAGDGNYRIGPGRLVIQVDRATPSPEGPLASARMTSYEMRERLSIVSTALFWKTQVTNDTVTRATPRNGRVLAEGTLRGRSLRWSAVPATFRTDGSETCAGSFCGSFGAPPPGTSEFHQGPDVFLFKPFEFSADMKTFSMQSTFDSKSESPKQVSYVALAGREVGQSCAGGAPL